MFDSGKSKSASSGTSTAEELAGRGEKLEALVKLLRNANGLEVPLPEVMAVAGAQYNARIFEARHKLGLRIVNRTEVVDGVKRSWFRLVVTHPVPEPEQVALFGDQLRYADPEEFFG
jgi:hypothetical protein